jgi:hypothetical protein
MIKAIEEALQSNAIEDSLGARHHKWTFLSESPFDEDKNIVIKKMSSMSTRIGH